MKDWTNELTNEKEQVVYVNCNTEDKIDVVERLYRTYSNYLGFNKNIHFLYIGNKNELLEILKGIFPKYQIKTNNSNIYIKDINDVELYFNILKKYNEDELKGARYDVCIIDTPFNCNDVKYAPIPICKKCIRIIPKQMKIINSPSKILDETKQYGVKDQIELEIKKLSKELLSIEPSQNNTMTREKVIHMLSKLVEIKEKL